MEVESPLKSLCPQKMDASLHTRQQSQRTAHIWAQNRLPNKSYRSPHSSMESLTLQSHAGASFATVVPPTRSTTPLSIETLVLEGLQSLFEFTSSQNLGPTRSARLMYLWFATITQAYNWIQSTPLLTGVKDGWNWDLLSPIPYKDDHASWMMHILLEVQPSFVPTFSKGKEWMEQERVCKQWSPETQDKHTRDLKFTGNWNKWKQHWSSWFQTRQVDGSLSASRPFDAPNQGVVLTVASDTDPATFPSPSQWTPLQIGPKVQSYLTYHWGSVVSTGLSEEAEQSLYSLANTSYPGAEARRAELAEVLQISQTLTDEQKVQSEFWAGGPYTVSPPGMCIWFWKEYMRTFQIANNSGYRTFFVSGLDLAIHLFETSRIVWGLKKAYMQARPIQEIRQLYRGQSIVRYDGTPTTGEHWLPYQEATFVTPPFADFPSGHSAFSQSFANVMTKWFGPTIPTSGQTTRTDCRLLSPVFDTAQTGVFASFVFPAGQSQIQTGIPVAPVTLSWSTWQEMADSAGLSRKYGGIHATSAHVGSQAVAIALHTRLSAVWNL